MTKYIIKYTFIWNGKITEDYAIREGIDPDVVKFAFIDQFRQEHSHYLISVHNIKLLDEIDLKTEIEKLKASAKEMLETLEKIKL